MKKKLFLTLIPTISILPLSMVSMTTQKPKSPQTTHIGILDSKDNSDYKYVIDEILLKHNWIKTKIDEVKQFYKNDGFIYKVINLYNFQINIDLENILKQRTNNQFLKENLFSFKTFFDEYNNLIKSLFDFQVIINQNPTKNIDFKILKQDDSYAKKFKENLEKDLREQLIDPDAELDPNLLTSLYVPLIRQQIALRLNKSVSEYKTLSNEKKVFIENFVQSEYSALKNHKLEYLINQLKDKKINTVGIYNQITKLEKSLKEIEKIIKPAQTNNIDFDGAISYLHLAEVDYLNVYHTLNLLVLAKDKINVEQFNTLLKTNKNDYEKTLIQFLPSKTTFNKQITKNNNKPWYLYLFIVTNILLLLAFIVFLISKKITNKKTKKLALIKANTEINNSKLSQNIKQEKFKKK
ncbi:hypothetical protein [Mycoplasmopsis cynos]|uniref:hypothetical protein n=1 Tax=Mycoplasmopsis cynos TaxID=171284 RepID=UPI002AFE9E2F|nr:hypothetical protein [Mycoplasmopsis cynos]WQQ17491.1 hypothetical protein RRG56_02945 [Mycoplasmopsis cynos]